MSTHPTTMSLGEEIPEDVAAEIEAIRAMYGDEDAMQKVLRIQKLMMMRKDDDDDAAVLFRCRSVAEVSGNVVTILRRVCIH